MITSRLQRPTNTFAKSRSWVCPSCTRTSLPAHQQRRAIHKLPPLSYYDTFEKEGVPGLMSSDGFKMSWTGYQTMLIQKLNELTAGEPIANMSVKDITLRFARDPLNASIFNHASALHNNHLFFSTLAPRPAELSKNPALQESLTRTFGSIESLRLTFLDTAASMFGPGFVWLVWARGVESNPTAARLGGANSGGNWRILTTYLAGTPYAEAGYRAQGIDAATESPSSYHAYMESKQATNLAGSFGPYSQSGKQAAKLPPGGTSTMPVLCVSTWEHTYIYDYGLMGKRQFLSDWWKAIDWGVVNNNAPLEATTTFSFERGRP